MFGRSCHGSPNSGTLWSLQNNIEQPIQQGEKQELRAGEVICIRLSYTDDIRMSLTRDPCFCSFFANPCFLSTSILLMSASGALSDLRLRNSQPIIELGLFESMTCKAMTKLAAFRILGSGHENNTVTQGCMTSSCPLV